MAEVARCELTLACRLVELVVLEALVADLGPIGVARITECIDAHFALAVLEAA